MTLKRYLTLCAVFTGVICICACSQKQGQLTQVQSTQLSVAKKTLKPGAAVSLVSPRIIQMNANQQASVELHLQVLQKGRLQIKLSSSDGLQLLATPAVQSLDITTTEVILPIQLNAANDGRFYVHIDALLETADGATSRNLAVAVQVGNVSTKALKPSLQASQDDGEAVVSLPAQETIKP